MRNISYSEEITLIHLANLVDLNMPFYGHLKWGNQSTQDVITMMTTIGGLPCDITGIDNDYLTKVFNSIRQIDPEDRIRTSLEIINE